MFHRAQRVANDVGSLSNAPLGFNERVTAVSFGAHVTRVSAARCWHIAEPARGALIGLPGGERLVVMRRDCTAAWQLLKAFSDFPVCNELNQVEQVHNKAHASVRVCSEPFGITTESYLSMTKSHHALMGEESCATPVAP